MFATTRSRSAPRAVAVPVCVILIALLAGPGCTTETPGPSGTTSTGASSGLDAPSARDYLPAVGDTLYAVKSLDGHWTASAVVSPSEASEMRVVGPNGVEFVVPFATPLSFSPDSKTLVFSAAQEDLVSAIYVVALSPPFLGERLSNFGITTDKGFTKNPSYVPVPARPDDVTWATGTLHYSVDGSDYAIDLAQKEVRRVTP